LLAKALAPVLLKGFSLARAALVPIGLSMAAYKLRPLGAAGDTNIQIEGAANKRRPSDKAPTDVADTAITKQAAEALFVDAGCSPTHASVAVDR
jgi:hypothetical protein